ncbi:copper ion binding protein [Staphylospora marina]|uniref:copper ion binding protein n=1 Tax=Staphylospora marina TaxID=2490858 RepID=UPI000F5B9F4F|nr:copper ion binding protein [Staphylospora marina]
MKTVELKVEGMSCGHCVKAVESALERIGAEGTVDLAGKTVTVRFDENRLSLEKIREAIEDQGYDVTT